MSKRARGNGGVFRVKGSRFWWISYQLNSKLIRESSGELTKTGAANKLKDRLLAIGNGNFLGPRIEKITVDELYDDLLQDYRIKSQTVEWAERVWNVHLKDFFSGMRASHLGTNQITGYVEKRMGEGAAKSTINRELALLRRAFSIAFAAEPQKVVRVPKFHKHIVSEKGNERRGFVEEHQYRKLADGAAAGKLWLRTLLALGYTYGFRKAELLEMRCKQVDLLTLRREKHPEDFLITRANGEPVKDFRETWELLVSAAGIPGLLFHDLRRSAVRNMGCAAESRKRPPAKFPATRRMRCSRVTISCPKQTSGMRPARLRKAPRPRCRAQFIVHS